MEPVRVGVVGTGNISSIYLENSHKFREYEVIAVADILQDRAQAQADKFSIPRALSVDELIVDPEVELVLNLTIPAAHAGIAVRSLEAGKVAYGEKPLATNREDGQRILDTAAAAGLVVGCAPDTFLGAGIQTVRRAIDAGRIGTPHSAMCGFASPGPTIWHPDPVFFFQPGGGPVLDMGPYYITTLVNLLGPVKRVSAQGFSPGKERTIETGPKAGQTIPVEVMTTVSARIEMESGVLATMFVSWDVWETDNAKFEIYGEDGALSGWDPNTFGGPIKLSKCRDHQTRRGLARLGRVASGQPARRQFPRPRAGGHRGRAPYRRDAARQRYPRLPRSRRAAGNPRVGRAGTNGRDRQPRHATRRPTRRPRRVDGHARPVSRLPPEIRNRQQVDRPAGDPPVAGCPPPVRLPAGPAGQTLPGRIASPGAGSSIGAGSKSTGCQVKRDR